MRSLFLLLFLTPLSTFASQDCIEAIEKIKSEAEAFVLELYMSIVEVLIKSEPKSKMISRIQEMQRSFNEFPLQISEEKTKELNDQLSSKLAAEI